MAHTYEYDVLSDVFRLSVLIFLAFKLERLGNLELVQGVHGPAGRASKDAEPTEEFLCIIVLSVVIDAGWTTRSIGSSGRDCVAAAE